jgi:hypothetical protein
MELVDLLNSRNARPDEEGGKQPAALLAHRAPTRSSRRSMRAVEDQLQIQRHLGHCTSLEDGDETLLYLSVVESLRKFTAS